jgi:putative ABC transport system permease protein
VGAISYLPLTWEDGTLDVRLHRSDDAVGVREYSVDANFLDLFGLRLVAGENFRKDLPLSNEKLILVNERFVQRFRLGAPQEAIGRPLLLDDSTEVSIAGVLKDFFFKPATYELEPMMLRFTPADWNILALKLRGGEVKQSLAYFEASWKRLDPFHPFDGRSYDDIIEDVYDYFTETMTIVGFLTIVAFVVSLLGLLGIVTFQVESRIKEIGVRKVLGAGMGNLLVMLSRRELVLLLIATVVAIPLSLWIASLYLETFAHRIELGVSVVLPAVLIVYLCAGVTIGWQTLRAASANPVEALRYE